MRPGIKINVTNGNLGQLGPSQFGNCILLVACADELVPNWGSPFTISNPTQAADDYFKSSSNAAVLEAIRDGFYAEAPLGTKLTIMPFPSDKSMGFMLSEANVQLAMQATQGQARMMAVCKLPAAGYTFTANGGFDPDVHDAVAKAQTIADSQASQNTPLRVLVQGYGYTTTAQIRDYSAQNYKRNRVGITLPSVNDNQMRGTLLILGRAAKASPQENIGKVKLGSLNIPASASVKVGQANASAQTESDLEKIYDHRYISIEPNRIAAGFVVTDDVMLTQPTDDYSSLRHGRVIDNCHRVAFKVYYRELKDDVTVDEDGRLSLVAEKALETAIEQAIAQELPGQFNTRQDGNPEVTCFVNPDPVTQVALYQAQNITAPNLNVLQSGQIYLFISCQPKGCLQTFTIYLGLKATV